MKAIRYFRVAGGQGALVVELPARGGLSEACVVVKAATGHQVHNYYFADPDARKGFVAGFSQRNASYAVAGALSQREPARVH